MTDHNPPACSGPDSAGDISLQQELHRLLRIERAARAYYLRYAVDEAEDGWAVSEQQHLDAQELQKALGL